MPLPPNDQADEPADTRKARARRIMAAWADRPLETRPERHPDTERRGGAA